MHRVIWLSLLVLHFLCKISEQNVSEESDGWCQRQITEQQASTKLITVTKIAYRRNCSGLGWNNWPLNKTICAQVSFIKYIHKTITFNETVYKLENKCCRGYIQNGSLCYPDSRNETYGAGGNTSKCNCSTNTEYCSLSDGKCLRKSVNGNNSNIKKGEDIAVIGWIAGGIIGLTVVLLIVAVFLYLRKRSQTPMSRSQICIVFRKKDDDPTDPTHTATLSEASGQNVARQENTLPLKTYENSNRNIAVKDVYDVLVHTQTEDALTPDYDKVNQTKMKTTCTNKAFQNIDEVPNVLNVDVNEPGILGSDSTPNQYETLHKNINDLNENNAYDALLHNQNEGSKDNAYMNVLKLDKL